jgi:hypothetical protein
MKRLAFVAATALACLFVTATAALAQVSDFGGPGGPTVKGKVVHPPSGTAFTGANLTIWFVAIAALVVVGTTLLVLGRRRTASVT